MNEANMNETEKGKSLAITIQGPEMDEDVTEDQASPENNATKNEITEDKASPENSATKNEITLDAKGEEIETANKNKVVGLGQQEENLGDEMNMKDEIKGEEGLIEVANEEDEELENEDDQDDEEVDDDGDNLMQMDFDDDDVDSGEEEDDDDNLLQLKINEDNDKEASVAAPEAAPKADTVVAAPKADAVVAAPKADAVVAAPKADAAEAPKADAAAPTKADAAAPPKADAAAPPKADAPASPAAPVESTEKAPETSEKAPAKAEGEGSKTEDFSKPGSSPFAELWGSEVKYSDQIANGNADDDKELEDEDDPEDIIADDNGFVHQWL
jgi:hypothetical protein